MNFDAKQAIRGSVIAGAISLAAILASCTGSDPQSQAPVCSNGLDRAYREFEQAEADGFGGAVGMTKAASLLAAAKVQQQFEEYTNCIEKVNRARQYIRQARKR